MSSVHAASVPRPRVSEDQSKVSPSMFTARSSAMPSSPPSHARRPSIPLSPSMLTTSPRSVPVPVPQRHGSISLHTHPRHSPHNSLSAAPDSFYPRSISPGPALPAAYGTTGPATETAPRRQQHQKGASSASLASLFAPSSLGAGEESSLSRSKSEKRRSVVVEGLRSDLRRSSTKEELLHLREDTGSWLDITGDEILAGLKVHENVMKVVKDDMGMEEAVEVMIQSNYQCLLVQKRSGYAFFDYADLNTFLLLVLHATSPSPEASRSPSRHVSVKRTSVDFGSESAIEDDALDQPTFLDERSKAIVARMRRFEKVAIGSVCGTFDSGPPLTADISGKDPYHAYPVSTPLRTLLPLFASGLHKIALTTSPNEPPQVVTDLAVLEHLVALPESQQPTVFRLAVTSPTAAFPLHPLISLPGTASVLDAMQVMSINGLSALGVLSGSGTAGGRENARRQSSGSSGSSSGALMFRSSASGGPMTVSPLVSPTVELMTSPWDTPGLGGLSSVVTAKECTRVVVPSEGKQVLGMGLEAMVKTSQYIEEAGQNRGEERVPVHTIPHNSTILHAAHLILATSSSRVFLRPSTSGGTFPGITTSTPPLSPSLTTSQSSMPSSPSLSALSLSDPRLPTTQSLSALPAPPPTQLSTHYVVSTLDILSCLARAYHEKLTPPAGVHRIDAIIDAGGDATRKKRERDKLRGSIMIPAGGDLGGWGLDPVALRRRRQSSFVSPIQQSGKEEAEGGREGGYERWRWASRVDKS